MQPTYAVGVGISVAKTALVATLAALSAPLAALLARLLRHEPLARHQWVGIASSLAGLVLPAAR
jgi:drug/metabolite transporter (DMT)-like permease